MATMESFPEERFHAFGSFLYDMLFDCWAFNSMECERPSGTLPDDCLVGKYGKSVVHHSVEFDKLENANVDEY